MNPLVITDNLDYLLVGAWPDGPIGGLALTLILSGLSGLAAAALGLVLGVGLAMSAGAARTALAGSSSPSRNSRTRVPRAPASRVARRAGSGSPRPSAACTWGPSSSSTPSVW